MKHATTNFRQSVKGRIVGGLALGLAGALALSGCGASNGTGAAGDDAGWTIGHSFADLQNPMYAETRDILDSRMSEIGAKYQATDSRQDASTQLNDIENLVQKGVDLLIIDPVDESAVVPGIEAANNAGIPVLMLVKEPTGGKWDARIFLDQVAIGYAGCEFLATQLGDVKKVIQLQGIMSIAGYRERAEGCEAALSDANVEIIAQMEGGGERTKSMDVIEALLKVHPDVTGIFGNNDEEALGAIEALRANGVALDSVAVVGIDGTELALQSMCIGELRGTVSTPVTGFADAILKTAAGILEGNLTSPDVVYPYELVSLDNVTEMIDISGYEIGSCPSAA